MTGESDQDFQGMITPACPMKMDRGARKHTVACVRTRTAGDSCTSIAMLSNDAARAARREFPSRAVGRRTTTALRALERSDVPDHVMCVHIRHMVEGARA